MSGPLAARLPDLNSPAGFDAAPAAVRWHDENIICFDLFGPEMAVLRGLGLGSADVAAQVIVRDFLLREQGRARRRGRDAGR